MATGTVVYASPPSHRRKSQPSVLGPIFPQTKTSINKVLWRPFSTQELLAPSLQFLTDIATCTPTVFKGLHGSLTVTKAGNLPDIGIVHFDPRARLSIISASDCLLQGNKGSTIDQDAFLLRTDQNTYKLQQCGGLHVSDLTTPPEPCDPKRKEGGNVARGGKIVS